MAAILPITGPGRVGSQHTGIVEIEGAKFLFSYAALVGVADDSEGTVYCGGPWSVTTNRHIRQFQRAYPGETIPNTDFDAWVRTFCARFNIARPSGNF